MGGHLLRSGAARGKSPVVSHQAIWVAFPQNCIGQYSDQETDHLTIDEQLFRSVVEPHPAETKRESCHFHSELKETPLLEAFPGSKCSPPCGPEAACRHFPNSSALCVCVHDASAAVQGRKCPRVTVPVSLRAIPVVVPTNGSNESVWRTSVQQAPGQLPAKPSPPPWGPGGSTLQTAAAVSLLLVALLLSSAVSCIWRRLLAARSAALHSALPQRLPLSDGEDGLGGTGECLLQVGRDASHRPRPPAPAPA